MGSPHSASLTRSGPAWSRSWARWLVLPTCMTMKTAAGSSAGRPRSKLWRVWKPPAEVPMATMSWCCAIRFTGGSALPRSDIAAGATRSWRTERSPNGAMPSRARTRRAARWLPAARGGFTSPAVSMYSGISRHGERSAAIELRAGCILDRRVAPLLAMTQPRRSAPRDDAAANAARSALMRARHVAQHLDFELLLLDDGAHEIADADDADDLARFLDRHVADAVHGHEAHHLADEVARMAGDAVGDHELPDGQFERRRAEALDAVHEVALAEDAGVFAPAVIDEERADIVVRQLLHRGGDGVGRPRLMDETALVVEDVGDAHRGFSRLAAEPRLGRPSCRVGGLRRDCRKVKFRSRAATLLSAPGAGRARRARLLQFEDALGVGAAHRRRRPLGQGVDAREAARHVADIVRVVGAVHDLVGAADGDAEIERLLPVCDGVVIDVAEIFGGLARDLDAAGIHLVEALVEAADEVGEGAAGMARDELQIGVGVEEAVEDHARHGERRVEHEADRGDEVVDAHVELGEAGRRRRVHEDGKAAPVDRLPDRREFRVRQRFAVDIGEDDDADGALGAGAVELGHRLLRVLPGERGHPADAVRPLRLRPRHVVVHHLRRLEADLRPAPIDVGAGQGEDGEIDLGLVHLLDAQLVVEMAFLRRHEGGAVPHDGARPVLAGPHRVARAAMLRDERDPLLAQHVRVDVDDRHGL